MKCPKPTQDSELNLANQKKAMDKIGYGPENPSGEDEKFWESKAREWDLPIEEAKSRRCGNCAVYNQSSDMMGCITKGMGDDVKEQVENKEIGYCESLNFICSSKRTCDAWAPRKKEEKAGMFDLYLKKVDEFLTMLEVKDINAEGTYEIDVETKVRKVKDSAYWGRPVGTPIVPGMKPEGPKSPMGRARRAAGGGEGRGGGRARKKIRPARKAKKQRRESIAGSERTEVAGGDNDPSMGRYSFDSEEGIEGAPARKAKKRRNVARKKRKRIRPGRAGSGAAKKKKKGRSPKRPESDSGPKGMSDNEREEFTDLDSGGKDKYTGARNHGYDHEAAMDYAEGVEGNQVERDAELDPDTDFARAVGEGKLREWTESRDKDEDEGDKGDGPDTSVMKAEDFSVDAAAERLKAINKDGRSDGSGTEADPIDVGDDIELAHKLLSEGKHIRMKDERSVSTLLDRLHDSVKDAKEKGNDAPEYDLCKVSVPKTNLFCVESKGIPRTQMPQFKGTPVDGSFAATKTNDKGEGDVEAEFRELLSSLGIETSMETVPANELKASQENLDGPKVVGMAQAMREGKIPDAPIFVTKDGYILDGHHRWAAKVAMDLDDGVTGDIEMPVEVIDAEIGYLIDLSNGFTEIAGIKPKGLGAAADATKRLPLNPDGTLCLPCMANWK